MKIAICLSYEKDVLKAANFRLLAVCLIQKSQIKRTYVGETCYFLNLEHLREKARFKGYEIRKAANFLFEKAIRIIQVHKNVTTP